MSSLNLLGLPPIPQELKVISPYLQRAEELKQKEPVVAYWCAYYAAQIGISLKVKTTPARSLLLELLGVLENMKNELGSGDIVDSETTSAAYVENFALRVFNAADDEERKGGATRSTAKKFLAAANFLEVLKVFPKADISESNEEKIRYAKWKAADLAKAFREGRLPIPGPPGAENFAQSADSFPSVPAQVGPVEDKSSSSPSGSVRKPSPPHIKRSSPPPHLDPTQMPPRTPPRSNHLSLGPPAWGHDGDTTPGSWSTAATPGTGPNPVSTMGAQFPATEPDSPLAGKGKYAQVHHQKSGSDSSSSSAGGQSNKPRSSLKPIVSDEPEFRPRSNGNANAIALGLGSGDGKKSVHFTPSVEGGLSTTDGGSTVSTPTGEPMPYPASLFPNGMPPPVIQIPAPLHSPVTPLLPPNIPIVHPSAPAMPPHVPPPSVYTSPPGPPVPSSTHYSPIAPPSRYSPPKVSAPVSHYSPPIAQHSLPSRPQPEVELTPVVIAKAQKHCRFAISALDYEDAEQARKELRAALAVLGG